MKIGFDAKRAFHNTTGLGNYSRDLITILTNYAPYNQYFLYNPKPKKVTRLQFTSSIKEVQPDTFLYKKFSSIWRQAPIVKQLKKDKITIFHGLSGEIPRGLKQAHIKSVVTIHDLIFIRYPKLYSFFDRKIHFKKHKYAIENADKIVAISQQTKKDIIRFFKINPDKIEVIYQGCHSTFKKEKSNQFIENTLKKYRLPKDFILNVGTIEKRKNVLSLIKAIKDIDISLLVVGKKTAYYKKVITYIEKHHLQEKVFFLEGLTLEELSALYQQAILFCYPSIFEGFGIPILEALYSKTPVLTSKNGVFPEAGGKNSKFINPLDVHEIKNAVNELLLSKEKRRVMIEKGYEFVQKFNDDQIAKQYIALYECFK